MIQEFTGGCLCGGVRYRLIGPLREVIACHCTQCRKTSGHHVATTSVPHDRFTLLSAETLHWFDSSPEARRGFCTRCGSNLFWEPLGEGRVSVTAGTIDGATGLTIVEHIHTETAGDYYSEELVT